MICNRCGNKISDDSKFCYKCGNKTSNNVLFCSQCGKLANVNDVFCSKCGHQLDNSDSVNINNNSSLTATKSDIFNTNTIESSSIEYDKQKDSSSEFESISKQVIEQQNYYSKNIKQELEKEKNKNKTYIGVIVFCGIIIMLIIILAIADNDDNTTSSRNYNTKNNTITNNNETSLTKTFTDRNENIAFNYPGNWKEIDLSIEGYDMIVALRAPRDRNFAANMLLYKADLGLDLKYLNNKDLMVQLGSQQGMDIQEIIDTKVDGIYTLKVVSLVANNCTSIQYLYNYNNVLYIITFTSATKSIDKYEPIFDAIMETYTITR